jgi:predicted amidophosphoribosyltransferase
MATACLYCGLQFPDTAEFCPQCGRPIERGFEIRPLQPSAWDGLGKEMKAKDVLQRQHGVSSHGSGPLAPMEEYSYLEHCPQCGAPLVKRHRTTASSVEKIEPIAEEVSLR